MLHPHFQRLFTDLRFPPPLPRSRRCIACGVIDARTDQGGDYCAECYAEGEIALHGEGDE